MLFPLRLIIELEEPLMMHRPTSLAAVLLITAALTGCAVQSTNSGTKPGQSTGGFMGLSKTDDVVVQTPDAFKGRNQVIIGSFKVGFLEEKKASAKAGGGLLGNGMGGKSSAHLKMNGITTATMQQITDAAYADFAAKLKAAGFTIADRSALLNSDDFKGVSSEPSPVREEASFFGSSNTVTYFSPKTLGDKIYWHGEQGHAGGFGFDNVMVGAANYADKSKTPVLFVSYLVDFANAEGSGGSWSMSSSVSVGQGLSVVPGGGVWIIGGQGGTFSTNSGSVKLGQPVYSTDTYGEIKGTSSDAAIAAETALNVATSVLGGGSNQSRDFEINANPAKYKVVAGKILGESNAAITSKMGSLK